MTMTPQNEKLDLVRALHLNRLKNKLYDRGLLESGGKSLVPDRWLEHPHWRCINDHVNPIYADVEKLGRAACLICHERILLTFPEDRPGPLLNGGM